MRASAFAPAGFGGREKPAVPGRKIRPFSTPLFPTMGTRADIAQAGRADKFRNLLDLTEQRRGAAETEDDAMKYMITWSERSQGSAIEYENAQKRILDVFRRWEAPPNFKIELFVIRVGDWGGYMLADCDDPVTVHKFCSMLPAFEFQARPVIPIEDAVRGELEVMAWRDGLKIG